MAAIGDDARMKASDYTRLLLLSALWGASFIFMRVAAPSFGTVWTAEARRESPAWRWW